MITYEEYTKLFQRDKNDSFVNLVIPASEYGDELNLIGKQPKDFSVDEVMQMGKYSADVFELVDKETIK